MSINQRTENRLEIKHQAEWAELKLGQSVFNFILSNHGLPHFPESMKKDLPPYMLETVAEIIEPRRITDDTCSYLKIRLNVEHETGCAELTETGMCNCKPSRCDYTLEEYIQTLTCAVCGESATGVVGGMCSSEYALEVGVYDGHHRIASYWNFFWDKYDRNNCDECVKKGLVTDEYSSLFNHRPGRWRYVQ
jgi:hypothetical protein